MSFFATWDAIAAYVNDTLGLKYLESPKAWTEAFKEALGKGAKYVDIVDDITGEVTGGQFYNPNGWINVGTPSAPSLETGIKTPPAITSVVTDAVTGGAVAGTAAVATEQVGITITLTTAGCIATALVGMGLGVAAFEAAPHFWTDLSNAMFEPITGHHLTYAETEPFLRQKISSLLSVDENGKPLTYVPQDIMDRAYDFIKTHITVTGQENTFPTATFDNSTGACTGQAAQTLEIETTSQLSLSAFQDFSNECAAAARMAGYNNIEAIDIRPLYEEMQSNLDLSDFDYVTFQFSVPHLQEWADGFVSNVTNVYAIGVCCYRVVNPPDAFTVTYRERDYADSGYFYYGSKVVPSGLKPSASGSMYWYTSPNGAINVGYDVKQNDKALYLQTDVSGTDIALFVGLTSNNKPGGIRTASDAALFRYTVPVHTEEYEGDEYLENNGVVITGKAPNPNKTPAQQYPNRYAKKKTVSQPGKEGDAQTNFVPGTTPMGPKKAQQIIEHGVNNEDPDSYREDQEDNQSGENTPNVNSPDDVNDSLQDNIDEYNDSDVDPGSFPDPSPDPEPYPPDPPTDPEGETDPEPDPGDMEGVEASGMVSVYNPTKAELISFSGWLWSSNFFDNFLKIFANPMDAIIGLHIIYATPSTATTPQNIRVGYLDSGVSSKVVDKQFVEIDCGTVNVPEYYGNAIDFEPYTQVHCYLPFIGIVSLKPNDILGKKLNIKYGVDVLTGTCLAILTTTAPNESKVACYNFAGNCCVQVPISGGTYAQMITGLASMAVGIGAGIATGNPIAIAGGAVAGAMSSRLDVSHSGSIGANAGAMGVRKPYLIITRKKAYNASNYNTFYGYPANKNVKLSACSGYTRVKSVHIDDMGVATDAEVTEIENLLRQGVIIK